jgi:hypothetical protein
LGGGGAPVQEAQDAIAAARAIRAPARAATDRLEPHRCLRSRRSVIDDERPGGLNIGAG